MADVNDLNKRIADKDDEAIALLEALEDYRIADDEGTTPMAAAIRAGNLEALELMVKSKPALEYFQPLEKDTKRLISMQASHVSFDDIAETEQYIGRSADNGDNWKRTPLLEACRRGNRDAIRLLIENGAKPNAKDALKETALGLCLFDSRDLAIHFIDCCAANGKAFPVEEHILSQYAGDAEFYAKLIEHGRLSKKTKHLVFCLACALGDIDDVERQLAAGYKLDEKRPMGSDPLLEAAASPALYMNDHPLLRERAPGLYRTLKDPAADIAISSTSPEEIAAAMPPSKFEASEEDAEWLRMVESGLPKDIDPILETEQRVAERMALIDLLIERGIDPRADFPRDEFSFLSNIIATNEPRLLAKLLDVGVKINKSEFKDTVQDAIQRRCFRMVAPLMAQGAKMPKVESHWEEPYRQYLAWKEVKGEAPAAAPPPAKEPKPDHLPADAGFFPGFKAIHQSSMSWELMGESMLAAVLIDGRIVRLTYSNVYCPIDGIELWIRLADVKERTSDYSAVDDWLEASLVEELISDDDELLLREDVEDISGEQPWFATYEAELDVPDGKSRIEIAVKSPAEGFEEPEVLNDWRVKR